MKVKSLFIISKSGLFLKTLENYFKKVGISIFTIDNTTEALHFIKDLNPDIVLITKKDFSEDEFSSIKSIGNKVVQLVEGNNQKENSFELSLPINPELLIKKIEEMFNE